MIFGYQTQIQNLKVFILCILKHYKYVWSVSVHIHVKYAHIVNTHVHMSTSYLYIHVPHKNNKLEAAYSTVVHTEAKSLFIA